MGGGPDSATRLSRVEERDTLHNLNARLEYFLSRMKELEVANDDLQVRVDTAASVHKTQSDQLRDMYEKQLTDMRKTSEKDVELITELKSKLSAAQKEANEATKDKVALTRKAQLADELDVKLRAVTDERDRLASRAKEAEARAAELEKSAAVFEAKANMLEKKLAPLRDQLATAEELRRKESETYRAQIAELSGGSRSEIDKLKASYDKQLLEAMEKQKKRADEERLTELAQVREHFTAVEAELMRAVDEEKAARASADERMGDLNAQVRQLRARASQAEAQAAALEKTLAERIAHFDAAIARLDQQLQEARAARQQKEVEFNELMDVKISLAEELKTYTKLLEGEEERLGITPTKEPKRRRFTTADDGGGGASGAASGPLPYLATLDLINDSFALKNAGDAPAPLGGFKVVSAHATDVSFEFPDDFELQPGATVTVYSGKKNQRKKRDPRTELWWSPRYMWRNEGDEAIMYDSSGSEVGRLVAEANSIAEADPPTEAAGGGDAGGDNKCVIM